MFSLDTDGTSVLVITCIIFCAFIVLLIEESWFMLILPCCVFTDVPWITDEVWSSDEPFVVAPEGEISSWCLFSNFSRNVFINLSFLSNWFFKAETWSCSCTTKLSKILDILMLSICYCIRVWSISDISKSCILKEFSSLKKGYFIDSDLFIMRFLKLLKPSFNLSLSAVCMFFTWSPLIDRFYLHNSLFSLFDLW